MAIREDRIKGTRQKIGSAIYSTLIPFGADGKFIDMKDGLNLEEDLIMGGDHNVSIREESDTITTITETYAKQDDIDAGVATDFYRVETTISDENDGSVVISIKLWYLVNTTSAAELVQRKIITISENGITTEIKEVLNP